MINNTHTVIYYYHLVVIVISYSYTVTMQLGRGEEVGGRGYLLRKNMQRRRSDVGRGGGVREGEGRG